MMGPNRSYPSFWSALTKDEARELTLFNNHLRSWLMHIEYVKEYNKDRAKKKLPERLEIDQSNSPSDQQFFRANSLRDKMYDMIMNLEQS